MTRRTVPLIILALLLFAGLATIGAAAWDSPSGDPPPPPELTIDPPMPTPTAWPTPPPSPGPTYDNAPGWGLATPQATDAPGRRHRDAEPAGQDLATTTEESTMADRMEDNYDMGTPITGGGKLLGFLVSHAETTAQTVTFYDATSAPSAGNELLIVNIAPEQSPYYIWFRRPVLFTTGLAATYTNCDLHTWIVTD